MMDTSGQCLDKCVPLPPYLNNLFVKVFHEPDTKSVWTCAPDLWAGGLAGCMCVIYVTAAARARLQSPSHLSRALPSLGLPVLSRYRHSVWAIKLPSRGLSHSFINKTLQSCLLSLSNGASLQGYLPCVTTVLQRGEESNVY